MCGIAGILRSAGEPVLDSDLRSMAAAMAHRGPDASGTWHGPGVGLAHTRLSLFDLSDAANQPWVDHGDVLVFNGEIYNFHELRAELEACGRRFRTTSDTEVLFGALQEHGLEGALKRIRGMFAFAFHHGASGTTHLCRDRYGIKPLVYIPLADGIAFASEVKRVAGAPVAAIRRLYRRVPGLLDAVLNERDANSYDFLRGISGGFEDDALQAEAQERYGFLDPERGQLQAVSVVMAQTSLQALLQRNDRMGMSASIESRFPFLDEEVVGFALNLPAKWKLRRSRAVHDPKHPFVVDKAPVRSVAADYLGPELAARRKNGFPTPGLHGVRVRPGAFAGSWTADAFGAGRSFDRQIAEWHQPYDVAKLLSIEIFGRLFAARQCAMEVEEFVHRAVEPVS